MDVKVATGIQAKVYILAPIIDLLDETLAEVEVVALSAVVV